MSGRELRAPKSPGGGPGPFALLATFVRAGANFIARILGQELGLS
jgi:hypothetical protein